MNTSFRAVNGKRPLDDEKICTGNYKWVKWSIKNFVKDNNDTGNGLYKWSLYGSGNYSSDSDGLLFHGHTISSFRYDSTSDSGDYCCY